MAADKKKKREGKDRNKQDDIKNYWQRRKGPLRVRDYQWRVYAYRGNVKNPKRRWVRLDALVTAMSWDDALIQTANISLINPRETLNLGEGHKVVVYYTGNRDGTNWKKLWNLRITSVATSPANNGIEIEAADELEWLKRSKDDFAYRKGSGESKDKRPDGWYAHQVARDVARRYGIKVGSLVKGKHSIKELVEKNASPLSIIEKAYAKEREETGYKYVIRMKNGKLFVTRLRRSRELLIYGGNALDAQITRRISDRVATELTVRGKVKEGGSEKKKTVRVRATKKIRRRYGHIHDFWTLDDAVESVSAMRKRARREMAERQEPDREVSLTVPGYPGIQRGDAIRVAMKDYGLVDLVYVTGASHSVSPGQYTVSLTLSFDEFYMDEEGEKTREKLCKKARENDRKQPKFCRDNYDVFAPAKRKSQKRRNKSDDGPSRKKKPTVSGGVRP
jgi:hypothetical protein